MSEALTRIPAADLGSPVLTSITSNGSKLVINYSDGSTSTEDLTTYLDQLLLSIDNSITSSLATVISGSSILNPVTGTEKEGDIRINANIAYMYVNQNWLQLWPII